VKRRVCSYDMLAVPDPCFVLKDTVGEMYFCNLGVTTPNVKNRTLSSRNDGRGVLASRRAHNTPSIKFHACEGARLAD
jgi:hypothetical protein